MWIPQTLVDPCGSILVLGLNRWQGAVYGSPVVHVLRPQVVARETTGQLDHVSWISRVNWIYWIYWVCWFYRFYWIYWVSWINWSTVSTGFAGSTGSAGFSGSTRFSGSTVSTLFTRSTVSTRSTGSTESTGFTGSTRSIGSTGFTLSTGSTGSGCPLTHLTEDLEILWLMIRYGRWYLVKGGHGAGTRLSPVFGSLDKTRQTGSVHFRPVKPVCGHHLIFCTAWWEFYPVLAKLVQYAIMYLARSLCRGK